MKKSFPPNIKFKYNWRAYQRRVLDELDTHLDDNHLHIIAPPGAGKTILGLEVALRLNQATLILAPTVSIRNQWIQRFCDLFLQTTATPDWISRDIKNPAFLTVSTYQGLHAACSGTNFDEEELEEDVDVQEKGKKSTKEKTAAIIALLKKQNIGTIIVDEAHHLKNAWWQSLSAIKKALEVTIVGLTATPPYDVSYAEWQRYIELNGPIDAEISVPELVVEGDLCPHQDYVFFSKPTTQENEKIQHYRAKIDTLFNDIKADDTLIKAFEGHPFFVAPNEHLDWIYTHLEYYSASLIFLHAAGKTISKIHLEVIGDKHFKIPALNYEWMEILLTFYLYKDQEHFSKNKTHQEKITNKLKRNGAMERRVINFRNNHRINKSLNSSISKLKSIEQVLDFEYQSLKQNLRMVILTDYIRKEFLVEIPKNELELNKIGVLPIFEQLRRNNHQNIKIGVLTGSLIIIPLAALANFKAIAADYNITKILTTPLPFDGQYVIVKSNEQIKHDIVHIITQIFQKGDIEALVGTKSLLGEGWDAPAINALILASFVGSYVLSNQMRGRAIRTEHENIDKTSNIWHLACVDPTVPDGGVDLQLLKRRFKTFVGVSFREEISIENGMGRLVLPEKISAENEISNINNKMFSLAKARNQLKERWKMALQGGVSMIEEIKVPFPTGKNYQKTKSLYFNRTIQYLLTSFGFGLLRYLYEALDFLGNIAEDIESTEDLIYWLVIIGWGGVIVFGRLAFKTFKLYLTYRDIGKDVHQIAEALLNSLLKVGTIQTDYLKLNIISSVDKLGGVYCHLEGGTSYEASIFIKSLQEIIGTVDNPRYIIVRKSSLLKFVAQKDYHAVPEILGRKKETALYFASQWKRFVGRSILIYTRTIEGRKQLLKSKIYSLAATFEKKTERINKWK